MRFYPNIIIKLGLESQPQEKSLFRRITPKQLRENSGDDPFVYLKKQAVLLFQKAFEDTNVNLLQFNVSLTYKDIDGDDMIIHTPDDLTAALKEYMDAGKIKIFAQVQQKPSEGASTTPPSVHTSTQTARSTTEQEALNVTDAVEHVVGAIASATIMAANQVTRSLRDIKRAERVVIKPIRVATMMRGSCRAHARKKAASSASVGSKDEKVSTGETRPSQQEEEVKPASSSVNVTNEAEDVPEEETDNKPAPKSEESSAPSDIPSNEPQFIHGRHTCDGCLNTPIVGKRFHATPDYDLCATCFKNYCGDREFDEVELDQDRLFQDRWTIRLDNFRRKDSVHVCKAPSNSPRSGRAVCPFKQAGGSILEGHEHDLALKEAVRRSLDDIKDEPLVLDSTPSEPTLAEVLRISDAEAEAEEAAAVEKAIEMSMVESRTSECSSLQSSALKVSPDRSVVSKSSFAQDAAGCGDVATDLGEALDRIASEIDEMTLTFGRSDEEKGSDTIQSYVEEESVKAAEEPDLDTKEGATIIEGTESALNREETDCGSKNSWDVVDGEDDGVLLDSNEALGRAAQMIGSALFNSDMERSAQCSEPAESMSSVSSVPTTVHLERAEPNTPTPEQMERWALQLNHLHELGFLNDQANVETIERLAAANIGVNCTDEVSVQQVIDEMMKDW